MSSRAWRDVAVGVVVMLAAVAPAAAAPTLLSLSETASVSVPPDELTAELRATAEAPSAARAQAQVNAAMAAALAAARAVPGITVATAGYATWQRPPGSPGGGAWQASQGLTLKGHDATALLQLVGRLQQRGLAAGSLAWELSAPARKIAQDRAMEEALRALRGRAEAAARVLGLRFGAFHRVQLGAPPQIMPRPLFAAAAMAAPPPSVVAEDIAVSATVSADVTLLPEAAGTTGPSGR